MAKPKEIELRPHETIIAVHPEYVSGPGWSNAPTWVYIKNHATSDVRAECIQPEERSDALHTLFSVGAAIHAALVNAVPIKRVR